MKGLQQPPTSHEPNNTQPLKGVGLVS